MSLKALLIGELRLNIRMRSALLQRTFASGLDSSKEEILDITSVDTQPKFIDEVHVDEELDPELKRNKSRLSPSDRNVLMGKQPYEGDGPAYHHYSIEWKRKMFGRYGMEGSGVSPGVAWPTRETIAEIKEYEKVAYPLNIQDTWAKIASEKAAKEAELHARQADIDAKFKMSAQWEREFQEKIAKKEMQLRAVRERKEKMMEEIRQHFGFKVDPRDERFKQMMEQKELEDKKRRKQEKKKEKSEREMARLLAESNKKLNMVNENNANSASPKDLS